MQKQLETLLTEKLLALQLIIMQSVVKSMSKRGPASLSRVAAQGEDDTIYAIDRVGERSIHGYIKKEIQPHTGAVLIAEGIKGGKKIFTASGREDDAEIIIIMDPIDGSRGLMHGKRSAWTLAAAAPNHGEDTNMTHIFLAAQTEIPPPKQTLADRLWAAAGKGVKAERLDITTGKTKKITLKPSAAGGIEHGFFTLCRFFPGVKDIISEIEEELARKLAGYTWPVHYFEDQYICSGGQIHEMAAGHDRFVCDLRGLLAKTMSDRGDPNPLCCHPYDICTELIAREAGVIVARPAGGPLDFPLDTTTNVSWAAYANEELYDNIAPKLKRILKRRRIL